MKIVFMGTPEFAVPALQAIAASRHRILAVVTGQDVARGRGQKVQETPVKILAQKLGIPVLQPLSLKDPIFQDHLKTYPADLYVVVAFRILPPEMIAIPPMGAVNLHASLLPQYRGAAPINWALINNEHETGVTLFQIKATVDTGDILKQERVAIEPADTHGSLAPRLAQVGAQLMVEVLDGLESGTLKSYPQDASLATPAPKIFPEVGEIDWQKPAVEIKGLIHGLSPVPGAYTFFRGKRLKILRAVVGAESFSGEPGTLVIREKAGIAILTGQGVLWPKEMQFEGRRPLQIAEFLCGFAGQVGDQFAS